MTKWYFEDFALTEQDMENMERVKDEYGVLRYQQNEGGLWVVMLTQEKAEAEGVKAADELSKVCPRLKWEAVGDPYLNPKVHEFLSEIEGKRFYVNEAEVLDNLKGLGYKVYKVPGVRGMVIGANSSSGADILVRKFWNYSIEKNVFITSLPYKVFEGVPSVKEL